MSDDPVGGFVEMLSTAGAELAPGLSNTEIELVEDRFGIVFNSEHRALLREILPLGRYWPDWRDGNPDAIHRALQHPIDGALFDVEANSFWALGWGSRPAQVDAALQVARRQLATVPTLVPVYGHRYTPQAGTSNAHPVFSVVPTDVIYYGRDIRHYLAVEFPRRAVQDAQDRSDHSGIYDREVAAILEDRSRFYVPFWSELAENRPDDL